MLLGGSSHLASGLYPSYKWTNPTHPGDNQNITHLLSGMSHQVLLDLLEHMYFWAPSEWLSDSARLLHTSLLLKEAAVALVLGSPLVGIILHIFDSWHGHNRAKSLYMAVLPAFEITWGRALGLGGGQFSVPVTRKQNVKRKRPSIGTP